MIDGKIVYNKNGVYILKNCPNCGEHVELLEEDVEYHLSKQRFDKAATTSTVQTAIKKGCPYDCGICPAHDQHTCIGIIDVTKQCNLNCEMCFAKAGKEGELSLETIEKMIDFYKESENQHAEILQVSGGEPSLHKNIIEIIQIAKDKKIPYVMLNTNGIRIGEDEEFVKELSRFKGGFEIYLQFDGLDDTVYETLRGKKLLEIKEKAIENLCKYEIPTTLVMTVVKDVNENRVGEVIAYGMGKSCVRGVNFQPISYYGEQKAPMDRITLSSIINRIEKQTSKMILARDFIPLPCNVERVAITYLLRGTKGFVPITRENDLSQYKKFICNTFLFTVENTLKGLKEAEEFFSFGSCCGLMKDIKRYLPTSFLLKSKEEKIKFVDENTFRISVSSFVDKYNFDMKSMQKECVHFITPDLKRIPFSAYNIIHRADYDK